MKNPYESLPPKSFWRSGTVLAEGSPVLEDVYRKRFEIGPATRIATAGSCFAQHIGRELRSRGFSYVDAEPAPAFLPEDRWAAFGYGLYSCRYGNIYTVAQLRQLLQRAFGAEAAALGAAPSARSQSEVWRMGERFADPLRPTIEAGGFASPDEVAAARQAHLRAVRRMVQECDVFTFTLGLTEAWCSRDDGTVYPVCPGTAAGEFSADRYVFKNFSFGEIFDDLRRCITFLRSVNPTIRILLTVSPVPLTATASDSHVLVATTYSKAVLRAVAGEIYNTFDFVDYFPSFELVTTHIFGHEAFEANRRSVRRETVAFVMEHFFREHGGGAAPAASARRPATAAPVRRGWQQGAAAGKGDVLCDEEILEIFNEH